MAKQWRCFHCDELFTRRDEAALHFGADQGEQPACVMRDHEHSLVIYIRRMEQELARYRDDDSDVMRSIRTLEAEQAGMIRAAEEEGYAKGLRDGRELGKEVA